jgi:hypothetical protein
MVESKEQEIHLLSLDEIRELWGWFDFKIGKCAVRGKLVSPDNPSEYRVIFWESDLLKDRVWRKILEVGSFYPSEQLNDGKNGIRQLPSGIYTSCPGKINLFSDYTKFDPQFRIYAERLRQEEFREII